MSAISRLRKKWNYEGDVPRCEICASYRKPVVFLKDSMPRKSPAMCKVGAFSVKPNAVCDMWNDKDGTVLVPTNADVHGLALGLTAEEIPDNELPGMWENADFTGGQCDA